jgi:GTP-binding protein
MVGWYVMAFVDEIRIHAQAGKGGNGVVRWLHSKETARGGPSGGDGGRGGDIVLEGIRDLGALASYRYAKKFKAEHGGAGSAFNKHGADGEPLIIKVPVGTTAVAGTETYEILEEGQKVVIFKGGPGGFGNNHFKSSTNQNPFESTPGKPGEAGDIHITLKLIADAGLIGFPNAGKSSLLNALTRAKSKVGAYPFTTLDPHLGDFYGRLLADIPGLIEGASEGRGLGSKFLRHVERTGFLVHLVSAEQEDVAASYRAIRAELAAFGQGLAEKPELVVLSKVDTVTPEEQAAKTAALEDVVGKGNVIPLSVIDDELLKSFSDRLSGLLTR